MAIKQYRVYYSTLVDPGSVCTNPTITPTLPTGGLAIVCDNGDSVDIQINTDIAGPHCLSFIIDCTGTCDTCGSQVIQKCFCTDSEDCGECENCVGNVCVSRCEPGKVCNNDTCGDCSDEFPCPANQVCSQGVCRCPADKPILRADGVCVECLDGDDLGPCLICVNGTIVAIDCPDGVCNPNTGDCQECLNNGDCAGPNECCGPTGGCECCPGYVLDPDTNQCVPAPPCTSAQDCIDTFGKCYYCTPEGCKPVICPEGFICDPNTGDCVPSCEDGICPPGQGCLNGRCVPCDELSCTGSGPQCQYAVGCECVGQTCSWIDCDPENVEMVWTVVPGTPGTPGTPVPGSGMPALQGTTNITPLSIVYVQPPNGAGYMNHQFNLGVTNGTNGTWTLYHQYPSVAVSLGSGTSVSFDLAGTAPASGPNLVGFTVEFVETNTSRKATWGIYRNPPYGDPTAANTWQYEFNGGNGVPPQTQGGTPGTPGSLQLCATNGNFIAVGVSDVVTTGTMSISFVATGGNCLVAYPTGCGSWSGNVNIKCGGNIIKVPAPSFFRDPANCCDPTDPNCDGWGTGDPCQGVTVKPITLQFFPTFGQNGSGDGEFMVVADWESAGLTFLQMFYMNISPGCWSTAANPASASNDIQIVTSPSQSPWGPNPSALAVNVTMGDGGCVRLGHTCELSVGTCEKLQGEVCLTECSAFKVEIVAGTNNTYTAVPSMADETVTYEWSYTGLVNNTGQTVIITPVGGSSTLSVTARYGTPTKCTATDSISLQYDKPGCMNRRACNWDPTAQVDDWSCVVVDPSSYNCATGFFEPGFVNGQPANTILTPTVSFWINGVEMKGDARRLDASPTNGYTVQVKVDGVDACTHQLVVPQCYNCSGTNCLPAPLGLNQGLYLTPNCDNMCDQSLQINIQEDCVNNGTVLSVKVTGGTGVYTVSANKVGGPQVLPPTALIGNGSVSTPVLGNGVVRVFVQDQGSPANNSKDWSAACHNCTEDATALSNYSINCAGNYTVNFTLTADPFATFYTVQLLNNLGVQVPGGSSTWTGAGTYSMPLGSYPGDGGYTLRVTNDLGCVKNYDMSLNCNGTLLPCPISGAGLTYVNSGGSTLFSGTFALTTAGGNYQVQLYNTTGGTPASCSSAALSTPIGSPITVVGVLGTNTINFPTPVSTPAVATCYGVKVQRLGAGYENCSQTAFVSVVPNASAVCDGDVTSIAYNTATGQVLVSWDFENTSDSLTVQIEAYSSGVCGTGTPVTVTSTGNGENGLNIPFNGIPQLQGTAQCVRVTIWDEADPTCTATLDGTIAACSCAVDVTAVDVDPDAETAEVTFTTRCTSGDVTIDITGSATGSYSFGTANTDGTVDTHTQVVALVGYPSVGGSINVEVSDDINGLCTDTVTATLPSNCVNCGLVVNVGLVTSRVETVIDYSANTLVSAAVGKYDLNNPTEVAELESVLAGGLAFNGANFCGGAPVEVNVGSNAGIRVYQDSDDFVDINYATVSSALWTGVRKAYFGACGCATGRLCDYTTVVDLSGTGALAPGDNVTFGLWYGDTGNTSYEIYLGTVSTLITGGVLAAMQTGIYNALTSANCGFAVGSVTASWNGGTKELTLTIADTNAALFTAYAYGNSYSSDYHEFTQSGCV